MHIFDFIPSFFIAWYQEYMYTLDPGSTLVYSQPCSLTFFYVSGDHAVICDLHSPLPETELQVKYIIVVYMYIYIYTSLN